jgi:PHD/YefM family antitoxin component YafN of YafNO toxin-antitoxin module
MNPEVAKIFPVQRIWLTAVLVAAVLGLPVAILVKSYPWVIAVPISLGVVLLLWVEMLNDRRRDSREPTLFSIPREFRALSGYRGLVALFLPTDQDDTKQDLFDFIPKSKRRRQHKEPIKITDPVEGEIYVIDCDRFVTLMVNKTLETADQIVEVSLKRVAERYGKMPSADLQRLLQDPGVVEVIKSDYRGNLILAINRHGEQILRDLVKQAKASESKQPRLRKA